ncbi:hypothetical protein OKW41_008372 [Paraburkholderia sp. UCT70]
MLHSRQSTRQSTQGNHFMPALNLDTDQDRDRRARQRTRHTVRCMPVRGVVRNVSRVPGHLQPTGRAAPGSLFRMDRHRNSCGSVRRSGRREFPDRPDRRLGDDTVFRYGFATGVDRRADAVGSDRAARRNRCAEAAAGAGGRLKAASRAARSNGKPRDARLAAQAPVDHLGQHRGWHRCPHAAFAAVDQPLDAQL